MEAMKFLLEVDLDGMASDGERARELGRVLRYWAGNVRHYDLEPGDGSPVYDSGYREVGHWTVVTADSPADPMADSPAKAPLSGESGPRPPESP
ncbi:hypothetical protein ACFVT5_04780 [Streptomyces sp. NPDC058001]|uniref:hypothetical protein n=1 Tax=Streptomyces sp. NPDC058001 TaxID=3346300 RepID=UPI0036E6BE8A